MSIPNIKYSFLNIVSEPEKKETAKTIKLSKKTLDDIKLDKRISPEVPIANKKVNTQGKGSTNQLALPKQFKFKK